MEASAVRGAVAAWPLLLILLAGSSCVGPPPEARWLEVEQWNARLRFEIDSSDSADEALTDEVRITRRAEGNRSAEGSGSLQPWSETDSETFRSWQGEVAETSVEIDVVEETRWAHSQGTWQRERRGKAAAVVPATAKLWIDTRQGTYSVSFEPPGVSLETEEKWSLAGPVRPVIEALCSQASRGASRLGCEGLESEGVRSEQSESRLPTAYFEREPLPESGMTLSGSRELGPGAVFTWELTPGR